MDLPVSISTANPFAVVAIVVIVVLFGWGGRGFMREWMEHRRNGERDRYDLAALIEEFTAEKMETYETQLRAERDARFAERTEYDKRLETINASLRRINRDLLERDWDTQAAVGWGLAQQEWITANMPSAAGMPKMPDRVRRIIERGKDGPAAPGASLTGKG